MNQKTRFIHRAIATLALAGGVLAVSCPAETTAPLPSAAAEEKSSEVLRLSTEAIEAGGIKTKVVSIEPLLETATVPGTLQAQSDALVMINARSSGQIEPILVQVGDRVEKNQVLAYLTSLDLAQTQAQYGQSVLAETQGVAALNKQIELGKIALQQARLKEEACRKQLERAKGLNKDGIMPRQDFETTQAAWQQAELARHESEIQLKDSQSGTATKELEKVRQTKVSAAERIGIIGGSLEKTDGVVPVKSPIQGKIVAGDVTRGQAVEVNAPLFKVVDVSRLLAVLDVPEATALAIEPGAEIEFKADALPGQVFHARVRDVNDVVDPETRQIQVRCPVENPELRLRPGMFVTARVTVRKESGVVIPVAAVQSIGDRTVVFMVLGQGRFQRRTVVLGARSGERAGVREGLSAGDEIVVVGAFWLKSELQKAQMEE
ncbi:MAG: efflux RND transporter periplasmic adaptor subunit [Candidatus Wallbacteria bacterium]|nr:efflux RND transporter periplasmic adaptor subunit [Candidatus Wallbacteria bacterium]